MKNLLLRVLPPLVIAMIALVCTGLLLSSRSTVPKVTPDEPTLARVTVAGVERGPVQLSLTAVGEVSASQDVAILSEVSGTIAWVDPQLHAGMWVEEGQVVARLDATTLDAEVAAARSTLASARQALALELGSGNVAALEARLVGPTPGSDPALIRREPQRASAEAAVASAEAALARTQRLRRLASIRAPFQAILAEESLDVGRLVTSSTQLGRWVGTHRVEISVPVPPSALPWFGQGTVEAFVRAQGAAPDGIRRASSVGVTGVVDATTRTAKVLVTVDAPYDTSEGPAILPGSFVEVTLRGTDVDDASRIPVEALVDGGAVWSVDDQSALRKVPVEVVWRAGDEVVIRAQKEITAVVARPSGTLLDGQTVRVRTEDEG